MEGRRVAMDTFSHKWELLPPVAFFTWFWVDHFTARF